MQYFIHPVITSLQYSKCACSVCYQLRETSCDEFAVIRVVVGQEAAAAAVTRERHQYVGTVCLFEFPQFRYVYIYSEIKSCYRSIHFSASEIYPCCSYISGQLNETRGVQRKHTVQMKKLASISLLDCLLCCSYSTIQIDSYLRTRSLLLSSCLQINWKMGNVLIDLSCHVN